MTAIHNCPYCGFSGDSMECLPTKFIDKHYAKFQVSCPDCYMRGPVMETEKDAIKAWNKLSDRVLKGV